MSLSLGARLREQLDTLVAKRVFLLTNTIFEGSIGFCHFFLPFKVYENAAGPISEGQVLFGRFIGLMMMSVALMTQVSKDRGVILGLACYHTCASAINAVVGCGIDGTKSDARDYVHASMHGFMAFGFWYTILRSGRKASKRLQLKAPWKIDGDTLELELVLKNWAACVEAVADISDVAEKLQHHPDVTIQDYKRLLIWVRTHCKGKDEEMEGLLGKKDVILARAIEQVPFRYSEKWLKELHDASWAVRKST